MINRKRILFVDDEPNVLKAYERSLREFRQKWQLDFCSCPIDALEQIRQTAYDTIISDVRMPGMTGLELLEAVKNNPKTADIPFVIVTGEADRELKRRALDRSADDLLNKPVDIDELVARIRSSLRLKDCLDQLKDHNQILERRVKERTAELAFSQIDIIWRLGKAAEYRDEETGNHVVRVGSYAKVIAEEMGLEQSLADDLFLAAPLHDIGKIGIPDSVLLKPGKLSDEQWSVMRSHCDIGVAILTDPCRFSSVAAGCAPGLGVSARGQIANPVVELAATIAASHHEKWNGQGYPNGLAGQAIPLVGRIVAVADVYDALRSERPYKQPFSIEKSIGIIQNDAGSHFDPHVVDAFVAALDTILEIENEFSDPVATEREAALC